MKLLNGAELRDYIKVRQAKQVRALRQAWGIFPKLAIIQCNDDPVIDAYVRLKPKYGEDILVATDVYKIPQSEAIAKIRELNVDETVHGIIVQLPLIDPPEQTQEILDAVAPEKDVDALGINATLDPATPLAINWLLAGYNVDLRDKKIVIVGNGRLVGAPLAKMWRNSGHNVTVLTREDGDIAAKIHEADIIVTATGNAGLITSDMIKVGAVVVDAGTASEDGVIKGDVAPEVYETRGDLKITPVKGGVGPLTVAALFDNVIQAARKVADGKSE